MRRPDEGFHTTGALMERAQDTGAMPLQLSLGTGGESTRPAPPGGAATGPSARGASRVRKRVARIQDVWDARANGNQMLAYTPREFVFFGLPYQRPKDPRMPHERRNGLMRLRVIPDPDFGVPWGQDRLLPLWLATAYKRVGQPPDGKIVFRAAIDILRAFEQPETGPAFAALKERLRRYVRSNFILIDERPKKDKDNREQERVEETRYNLVDKMCVWFNRSGHPNQHTLWDNYIVLSPGFAADLRKDEIPADLNTIIGLKENPMALDLYLWQAHRSWELAKKGAKVAGLRIFGPQGLYAQLGSSINPEAGNTHKKRALQLLRENQRKVMEAWPTCPNRFKDDEIFLLRPAEPVKKAKLVLPGWDDEREAKAAQHRQGKDSAAERLELEARPLRTG